MSVSDARLPFGIDHPDARHPSPFELAGGCATTPQGPRRSLAKRQDLDTVSSTGAKSRGCTADQGGAIANQLDEVLDAYAPPARPVYAVHASGGASYPLRAFLEIAKRHAERLFGQAAAARG